MKGNINQNPQYISESSLNLPSIDINTNFQSYEQEKKARKQTENQRKMLQLTVAALRRQAYQATKKYNENQDELMFAYNKKLTTLDETNKKEEFKRQEKQSLEKRRNFSSLTRYLHRVKKEEAIKNMSETRKRTIQQMKSYLQEENARKNKQKKQELRELSERRRRMSETNRSNVRWARSKSYRQKVKLSEFVRNQLIGIQQSRINKEQQTIQRLEDERSKILQVLQKNRIKNMEVNSMRDELCGMDLYDFESRVIKNNEESRITVATRKIEKSKRKKQEKRRDNFYY